MDITLFNYKDIKNTSITVAEMKNKQIYTLDSTSFYLDPQNKIR